MKTKTCKWAKRGAEWLISEGVRKWTKEPVIRYAICGQGLYLFPDGFERRRDSLKSDFPLTSDFGKGNVLTEWNRILMYLI